MREPPPLRESFLAGLTNELGRAARLALLLVFLGAIMAARLIGA